MGAAVVNTDGIWTIAVTILHHFMPAHILTVLKPSYLDKQTNTD